MDYKKKGRQDLRFRAIKPLLEAKHIKSFDEIFLHVPKTNVAIRLGLKVERFSLMISDPGHFRVYHIEKMAGFFNVDLKTLMNLVLAQLRKQKKTSRSNLLGAKKKFYEKRKKGVEKSLK